MILNPRVVNVGSGQVLDVLLTASDASPPLSWSLAGGADAAHLSVEGDRFRFAFPGVKHSTIPQSSTSSNTYFGRARCQDPNGNWAEAILQIVVGATSGLPAAIADLTIVPQSPTTALFQFTPPAGATSYLYSVDGENLLPLPGNFVVAGFTPEQTYTGFLQPVNAAGRGVGATASFTMPAQSLVEELLADLTDEVDRSTYTLGPIAIGPADPTRVLHADLVTQLAGVNHTHFSLSVQPKNDADVNVGSPVTMTPREKADVAVLSLSHWSALVPQGTRAVFTVQTRDSSGGSALVVNRCLLRVRVLRQRAAAPTATYKDVVAPLAASANVPAGGAVVAASAISSSTDVVPAWTGLSPDYGPTRNSVSNRSGGRYDTSVAEPARSITCAWPSGSSPRVVVSVYGPQGSTGGEGVMPVWSDDYLEKTAGVNTHINWQGGQLWDDDTGIPWEEEFHDALFRFSRSQIGAPNASHPVNRIIQRMYTRGGVRWTAPFVPGAGQPTAAQIAAAWVNVIGEAKLLGIEGPNEFNHNRPANWNTTLVSLQRQLFQEFRSRMPTCRVLGPSIWGRNTWDIDTLIATPGWDNGAWCTLWVLHNYTGWRVPDSGGQPQLQQGDEGGGVGDVSLIDTMLDHARMAPGKPGCTTETGWPIEKPSPQPSSDPIVRARNLQWGSELAQAKYVGRQMFDNWLLTEPMNHQFLVFYVLFDDDDTRPDKPFGLCWCNAARTGLVRRQAWHTVRRQNEHMSDRTWNGATWVGAAPTLVPLPMTLTGLGPKMKWKLSQQRSGRYKLAIWNNIEVWSRSGTPRDLTNAAVNVTLRPGAAMNGGVRLYEPTMSEGLVTNYGPKGPADSVVIPVKDHVSIIEMDPS